MAPRTDCARCRRRFSDLYPRAGCRSRYCTYCAALIGDGREWCVACRRIVAKTRYAFDQALCKVCYADKTRDAYHANPQKRRETQARYRRRLRGEL